MQTLQDLWNLILETNTFNFVLLVVVIATALNKLKVSDTISQIREEIVKKIDASISAKSTALSNLSEAKEKVKNLETEIEERIELARQQASNVATTIRENSQKRVQQIQNNSNKIIAAEEKTLKTELSDKTAKDAIEMSLNIIKNKIANNPQLHDKFIKEGIKELRELTL